MVILQKFFLGKEPFCRSFFFLVKTILQKLISPYLINFFVQVFKASGLAVADANIIRDKQFQLIRF